MYIYLYYVKSVLGIPIPCTFTFASHLTVKWWLSCDIAALLWQHMLKHGVELSFGVEPWSGVAFGVTFWGIIGLAKVICPLKWGCDISVTPKIVRMKSRKFDTSSIISVKTGRALSREAAKLLLYLGTANVLNHFHLVLLGQLRPKDTKPLMLLYLTWYNSAVLFFCHSLWLCLNAALILASAFW